LFRNHPIAHHIDFVQYVTRHDQVQTFRSKLAKSRIVSARHGVPIRSRLVRIRTTGLADRLRQSDSLPHALL
jgi:hypothetical protein